jgi:hypothetical protein
MAKFSWLNYSIHCFFFIYREFLDYTGAVCLVQMPDGNQYEGHGTNKKLAKCNACQLTLNSKH